MPIYEYECEACHKISEVIQRISEEPLSSCPECEGSVRKLVSQSSFKLKGGGWYADGYSSASGGECGSTSSAKSESAKPAETSKSTKSDSPCAASGCAKAASGGCPASSS